MTKGKYGEEMRKRNRFLLTIGIHRTLPFLHALNRIIELQTSGII